MLLNCGVGEDSWESLGLQGDQPWIFTERTDTEAEAPKLWPPDVKSWVIGKDPDAGKDWLRARGEVGDRGQEVWIASLTQWTWVWANSRRWWRTGKPGLLKSMVSQRAVHDWSTEQQEQLMKYMKILTWHLNSFEITCVILNTLRGVPWKSWMI